MSVTGSAPEAEDGLRELRSFLEAHREAIVDEIRRAAAAMPELAPLPASRLFELIADGAGIARDEPPAETVRELGRACAEAGARFGAWLPLVGAARDAVRKLLGPLATSDPDAAARIEGGLHRCLESAVAQVGDACLAASTSELRESERRYRLLFDASPSPMWVYDRETLAFLEVNDAAVRQYGYGRDELERMTVVDLRPPEEVGPFLTFLATLGDRCGPTVWRHRRKDGSILDVEIRSYELSFRGRPARLVVGNDLTERRRAEEARDLGEASRAAMLEAALDAIVGMDAGGNVTEFNHAAERMFGHARAAAIGRPLADLLVPPDLREAHRAGLARYLATGEGPILGKRIEVEAMRADGSVFPAEVAVVRIHTSGPPTFTGYIRDLSDRRRSEESLRRSEEQLRQAQKMDAIGQLAGGIAHDFNNLLTVILSYVAMLQRELDAENPVGEDLAEIRQAAERASTLTRQLLAFSRRQVMEARILDLNEIITSMGKMVARLIGEDIELVIAPARPLASVKADRHQLEQVIMNLVVNARDAMPRGGRLTIETGNVELDSAFVGQHVGAAPGPHVLLAISDTGIGMDRETQARIFEPFFTTKGPGKGTGLGLSMVLGIVQQSGGTIWVYSEPGRGTTFKVYLPAVAEVASRDPTPAELPATRQGTETILLAEDEDQVRVLAREILRRNGYRVLEARSGKDALLVCQTHQGGIDLLLTDVVMPAMSGRELADRVVQLRPKTRVLFMSGYPANAIGDRGVIEADVAYLQKPLTPDALLQKVREVLDRPASRARP